MSTGEWMAVTAAVAAVLTKFIDWALQRLKYGHRKENILWERIGALEARTNQLQTELDKWQERFYAQRESNTELRNELQRLRTLLESQESENERLRARVQELEARLNRSEGPVQGPSSVPGGGDPCPPL